MRMLVLLLLLAVPLAGKGQGKTETREMVGQIGSRDAYLVLHATERADGGWHMTGEYLLLPNLQRRFLDGERSPQIGVATLKEGTSAILFGRPATGELRGTLREGQFRGTRYGPGGQERERFEFSEEFPSMEGHTAQVRCEAGDERYASTLQYSVEGGKLRAPLEWRSRVGAASHQCVIRAAQQKPFKGGLAFAHGDCAVTLRELGEHVMVSAVNCGSVCASEAYLEPILVDRRGRCRLLRPEAR